MKESCLSLEGAFERRPFGESPLVMSLLPKKGFCDIYEGAEPLHIVLKRDPMEAEFLRPVHVCIQPGYHCNKRQGNSVYPDGTLPDEEIKVMLQTSCDLVRGKRKGEGE